MFIHSYYDGRVFTLRTMMAVMYTFDYDDQCVYVSDYNVRCVYISDHNRRNLFPNRGREESSTTVRSLNLRPNHWILGTLFPVV
jgi:hypothetical protein